MASVYQFDAAHTSGLTAYDQLGVQNATFAVTPTFVFGSGSASGQYGVNFDGTSQFIDLGPRAFGSPLTVAFWANISLPASGDVVYPIHFGNTNGNDGFASGSPAARWVRSEYEGTAARHLHSDRSRHSPPQPDTQNE